MTSNAKKEAIVQLVAAAIDGERGDPNWDALEELVDELYAPDGGLAALYHITQDWNEEHVG